MQVHFLHIKLSQQATTEDQMVGKLLAVYASSRAAGDCINIVMGIVCRFRSCGEVKSGGQ